MNEDFKKGLENGLDNLDKTHYEDFVSSEVNLEWLENRKAQVDENLVELRQKIEDTTQQKLEILEAIQAVRPEHDSRQKEINQLEEQVLAQRDKIADNREEKKKNPLHYPLLAGLIYFAAGIVFLLGDLIISHEIVAYALNIRNEQEAWAFACGLAGVTLLLKPAYERLIEEPYLKNPTEKSKKLHGYFQGALVAISIVTLSVLGYFRYEAYKVDKLKASINTEIKSLQLAATPLIQGTETVSDPVLTQKIEAKMKEVDTLNKELVTSPWALLSFVLSGVLFAIAGAICFGIAFPILSSYWKRWFWHNPAINRAHRRIKKINKQVLEIEKPRLENAAKLDFYQEKLGTLPELSELRAEKTKKEEEAHTLSEKIRLAKEASRVSIYNSGYDNGYQQKNDLNPEELKSYRKNLVDQVRNTTDGQRTYRSNGLRPYQALRKAITDSFNTN